MIFTMGDITELFFRALSHQGTHVRQQIYGGKISKERLTIILIRQYTIDEIKKPLLNRKSKKPRYFKNVAVASLLVDCKNH